MHRITKREAEKRWNKGELITFAPSKCSPQSMLAVPCGKTDGEVDFKNQVNHFHYYQCNRETGLRVAFYTNKK